MKLLVFICAFVVCARVEAKKLPSYVKTCKPNQDDSPACFKSAIEDLFPKLLKGIPEMGIPIIDPFILPKMSIDSGSGGSFAFGIDATDVHFYGFKDAIVHLAKIDTSTGKLSFILNSPLVKVVGKYHAKGKMLVIAIDGSGDMTFNFNNVTIIGDLQGTKFTRKEKEYYKFTTTKFESKIIGGSGEFGTLFANSPELTESTNKVFNENFDVAFEEFRPAIENVLSEILLGVVNSVHERYPIDELYPTK